MSDGSTDAGSNQSPSSTPSARDVPMSSVLSSGSLRTGTLLSVMMFLQYAVWGVWLPYLAVYLTATTTNGGLGFSNGQMGMILGLAGSIGAVSAPFIAGQVADRIMNAERALGLLLIAGGIVNILLSQATQFTPFLVLAICYSVLYMPTLSLTNSIAFQNLKSPEKSFPPVRLWGTVGWIAASSLFPIIWLASGTDAQKTARTADALVVSGIISIIYAAFALLLLPKTPPRRDSADTFAFVRAFALLKNPAFLVITLIALPIAMIHQCYFFRAANFFKEIGIDQQWIGTVMSVGQVSEIFFLLILGFILKQVGFKGLLLLGVGAYAVRFGIFATSAPPTVMIAAQVLHGLCYGCFFAGAFILVERIAGPDVRHSAQTVFGIVILGLGPILAAFYNDLVGTNMRTFWLAQSLVAAVSFVILFIAFPKRFATGAQS